MKKLFILTLISIYAAMNMQAKEQVDPNIKPESLPAKEFNFPKYETITLKNGLKVFIIKDDQQPTVSFRLLFKGGSVVEGDKTGVADLTAQILTKGAGKRTALDIANLTDGLGINISVNSSADFNTLNASGLKKHLPTLLELTRDVLTAPTFPADEFPKLQKLMAASIKQEKSRSSSVAAIIARKAAYGLNHPYSRKASEEGINKIGIEDLKSYFNSYFVPNNATMSIIGDVDVKEVKTLLEKYFADWKKGKDVQITIPAIDPMPLGVYFVPRPGAVQSSINVVTNAVPRNHPDFEAINLASSVMGAGFAGRLFKTLRETYSYTYTPFGYLTNSKYTNRFACGADVRGDVTDSSVIVIMEQLGLLANESPSDEELGRLKKYEIGQYLMSFSNKDYVGNLIQNADFYEQKIEDVKNYHIRLQNINSGEVSQAAQKYMNPASAYIVVVGDPKVLPTLEKFGKIYEFNTDYEPETGENAKFEKINMTPVQLLDKYASALGGREKINAIKTLIIDSKISFEIQGETMPGTMIVKNAVPNKQSRLLDIGVMQQSTWYNGSKGWLQSNTTLQETDGEELNRLALQSGIIPECKLVELGYECEVLGKQKGFVVLKATKYGLSAIYYFDENTFLLTKKESTDKSPDGVLPITDTFSNWKEYGGVKFPTVGSTETPLYTIKYDSNYKINEVIEDSVFTPAK